MLCSRDPVARAGADSTAAAARQTENRSEILDASQRCFPTVPSAGVLLIGPAEPPGRQLAKPGFAPGGVAGQQFVGAGGPQLPGWYDSIGGGVSQPNNLPHLAASIRTAKFAGDQL